MYLHIKGFGEEVSQHFADQKKKKCLYAGPFLWNSPPNESVALAVDGLFGLQVEGVVGVGHEGRC